MGGVGEGGDVRVQACKQTNKQTNKTKQGLPDGHAGAGTKGREQEAVWVHASVTATIKGSWLICKGDVATVGDCVLHEGKPQ